jgi:hypothetical protein
MGCMEEDKRSTDLENKLKPSEKRELERSSERWKDELGTNKVPYLSTQRSRKTLITFVFICPTELHDAVNMSFHTKYDTSVESKYNYLWHDINPLFILAS